MTPQQIAELIAVLLQGAATLVSTLKSKTASTAVADAEAADQIVLAILQTSATVKGLTIDWTDPTAVAGYIATLPQFVPLSDPTPPTGATPRA